jgi:hypothetical protein
MAGRRVSHQRLVVGPWARVSGATVFGGGSCPSIDWDCSLSLGVCCACGFGGGSCPSICGEGSLAVGVCCTCGFGGGSCPSISWECSLGVGVCCACGFGGEVLHVHRRGWLTGCFCCTCGFGRGSCTLIDGDGSLSVGVCCDCGVLPVHMGVWWDAECLEPQKARACHRCLDWVSGATVGSEMGPVHLQGLGCCDLGYLL